MRRAKKLTSDEPTIPECTKCGACCVGWEVDVFEGDDIVQIERAGKLDVDRDGFYIMKHDFQLRCSALKGRVGDEVSCSIYANRPSTCRVFERGSEQCLFAIERQRQKGAA